MMRSITMLAILLVGGLTMSFQPGGGYDYEADWERFKKAVFNEDIQGISSFANNDGIDAESLLMTLKADFVLDALKNTSWDDLETQITEEGDVYIVFTASVTEEHEGDTYESAIMLYFVQGDPNLELEYYIAAG